MPALKYIADMNISPITVKDLKNKGWDILRINEIMDARSSDIDILAFAKEQERTIITHDLDFSELIAIHGYSDPSVINLRLEDASPGFVTERLLYIVSELEDKLKGGGAMLSLFMP